MSTCPRFLTFWKKREKTTELDFESASPHERGPRRPHNREQQAKDATLAEVQSEAQHDRESKK
jgi:hypothetical protein